MIHVVTVVGARPQFVKAAVLQRALRLTTRVSEVMVHTGQHYDRNMSAVFFEQLGIEPPKHNLGVGSGPHGRQTANMLIGIEEILVRERPNWVVLFGDTNSTLAGAIAAAKLNIPIAHVEAGLRSYDRRMPEEVNRLLTDHVSTALFAPTEAAVTNLRSEGIDMTRVRLVGDVMYDAARQFAPDSVSAQEVGQGSRAPYALVTIHRASNTDDRERLEAILHGLDAVNSGLHVVWPMHPRTRQRVRDFELEPLLAAIEVIEPVGYVEMLALERFASVIVTDSGGVQKEAYFFGVPCVTVRAETEWLETVETGWNRLVHELTAEGLEEHVSMALRDRPSSSPPLFGAGDAADQIAETLAGTGYPRGS